MADIEKDELSPADRDPAEGAWGADRGGAPVEAPAESHLGPAGDPAEGPAEED